MGSIINLTGMRFGRLVAVGRANNRGTVTCWDCVCDCGRRKTVRAQSLREGTTKSCGCYLSEASAQRGRKHGRSGHALYRKWYGMRDRCENPNNPSFKNYGGRGVVICGPWHKFENFFADMEPTWRPGMTIERIDNDKGYSPENCEWIPRQDQSKNRRNVIVLDSPWGRMTLAETARAAGISIGALTNRVKSGWPQERLFMPARKLTRREAGPN